MLEVAASVLGPRRRYPPLAEAKLQHLLDIVADVDLVLVEDGRRLCRQPPIERSKESTPASAAPSFVAGYSSTCLAVATASRSNCRP